MSTQLITRQFEGKTFTFREDGYFNMTKAAKEYGKRVNDFLSLPSSKEYIEALAASTGKSGISELVRIQRGNGNLPQVGTWGHPKLAVFFARWLDVRFAVFCDMVIDDILGEYQLGTPWQYVSHSWRCCINRVAFYS